MVLASPGPLRTPPPSSSPPKTPMRSYSAIDNVGDNQYGENHNIGNNQYSSKNLSYCSIHRFLESVTPLTGTTLKHSSGSHSLSRSRAEHGNIMLSQMQPVPYQAACLHDMFSATHCSTFIDKLVRRHTQSCSLPVT